MADGLRSACTNGCPRAAASPFPAYQVNGRIHPDPLCRYVLAHSIFGIEAGVNEVGTTTRPYTGTVIRPDTVRAYAAEAGFDRIDVLPIEHDFWRFYRLLP